jgi:hypothetical protein
MSLQTRDTAEKGGAVEVPASHRSTSLDTRRTSSFPVDACDIRTSDIIHWVIRRYLSQRFRLSGFTYIGEYQVLEAM